MHNIIKGGTVDGILSDPQFKEDMSDSHLWAVNLYLIKNVEDIVVCLKKWLFLTTSAIVSFATNSQVTIKNKQFSNDYLIYYY